MFFVMFKTFVPEICAGCSVINNNMETMKLSKFNNEITKENLQIADWMNKISISGET